MTNFTIIIPARLKSSRLPEKLLRLIGNKTILEHSYLTAKNSNASRIFIAADDEKIAKIGRGFGADVVMTNKNHESGTERLAECVLLLGLPDEEIIINLQSDEPFMPPSFINVCADTLAKDNISAVSTLAAHIDDIDDIANPNVVKVVKNSCGHALYFSRAVIPFARDKTNLDIDKYLHHLGIYGYRAEFLKNYNKLPRSDLENIEKLEQLRILDAGEKIAVTTVAGKPVKGIDTEKDLQNARNVYNKANPC